MYKFSIKILIFNIYNAAASKYCSYEINGEAKYFICARNEYCCNFGCCVHLAFQFYQLWYYWLLLIFMFMICSGGSWWYKFCRQNDSSTYPSIARTIERPIRQNPIGSRVNRTPVNRVNVDPSTLYLHRMWKGNCMAPPPNYYTASVVRYHSASELESRRQQQECPYYQLYGPPPSYESVIQVPANGFGQPSCILMTSGTSQQYQEQNQILENQQQIQLLQEQTNPSNDIINQENTNLIDNQNLNFKQNHLDNFIPSSFEQQCISSNVHHITTDMNNFMTINSINQESSPNDNQILEQSSCYYNTGINDLENRRILQSSRENEQNESTSDIKLSGTQV